MCHPSHICWSALLVLFFVLSVNAAGRFQYRTRDGMDNFITFQTPVKKLVKYDIDSSLNSPIMYEISTRPYLYELSIKYQKPGMKLKDVPMQEFQRLKDLGVNMVWLMGMWSIGTYGKCRATDEELRKSYGENLSDYDFDDIIGSPYQVYDYVVNPEIGTDDDLAAFKSQLNSMGIGLILDFVPNHSAVDSIWVSTRQELYIQAPKNSPKPYDPYSYLPNGVANGKDPYFSAWLDTAQWNYWNNDTRTLQLSKMLKVASLADGIRCDMSMLLLNDIIQQTWGTQLSSHGYKRPQTEFWSDAVSTVKREYPNVKFLAEVYWNLEDKLLSLGFDYVYNKALYDVLSSGNMNNIHQMISGMSYEYLLHTANFVENHDEDRAVSHFGSTKRAMAAAAIMFTLPGMKFNHHGQWQGKRNRLLVQLRRSQNEAVDNDTLQFYTKLIPILAHDVFHTGKWQYLSATSSDQSNRLLAWKWSNGIDKRLVVIDFSGDGDGSGAIVLDDVSGQGDQATFTDLLTGKVYQRSVQEVRTKGLFVVVTSFQTQIFQYT
jgi:glycosidase